MIYSQGPVMCIVLSNHVTNQLFFFTTFYLPLSTLLKYSIVFSVQPNLCIKTLGMQVMLHLGAPPPNREVPPCHGGAGPLFTRSKQWLVIPEPTVVAVTFFATFCIP